MHPGPRTSGEADHPAGWYHATVESAVSPEDSRADLLLSGESVAFGKYWLTRLIARGGMGEVYLARLVGELGFEKRLVIKTILPHLAEKPRFVELFAAEAKTAVALSHGNIVPIYELGRTGDTFYIVMGHVDGPSLSTLLDAYRRAQRVPELAVALHIIRGVLTGLAYAHTPEQGRGAVVHRDITPRNVLVDRSGQVRIVDFGIAAPADAEVDMRAGSTGYAAPEQIRSGTVDPRADVFSAAALLYELVTLERAFPKDGVWSPPDFECLPDVLRGPLEAALAMDPEKRPSDAGELLSALAPAFARYAATFGDAQLSAHLRDMFPQGWDEHSKPAAAGEVPARGGGRKRPDTQTFATRLTLVTKMPQVPAPSVAPANAGARRWPWLVALVAAGGLAWGIATRSRPEPPPPTTVPAVAQREPPPAPTPTPETPISTPEPDASHAPDEIEPAPTPVPDAPAKPVRVALHVEPTDATILVDDEKVADPRAIELPADGTATVVVKKDGYGLRTFTVDAKHPLPARVVLKPLGTGFLKVYASGVTWAEVSVDGKKVGHTPTRKLELPEGKHKVVVKCVAPVCDNERTMKTQTVVIKADSLSEVRAE